jgi:hypothetical protein
VIADTREAFAPVQTAAYDVVAIVASAGGRSALERILHALPGDFTIPIVVMQHLSHATTEPLRPFGASLPFTVEWARAGAALVSGTVLVAPPRSFLEILPDGTCLVSPCERGATDKPMDRLLESIARGFAQRAVGVVLSGMLDDGAAGARELRAEGGCVIVQSDAEYRDMPNAAIRCGGADVSLPAKEIAQLLIDLAGGASIPRPPSELDATIELFGGEGRARAALRAVNWAETPLGPVLEWPAALSTAVKNVLSSPFPACIFWGPEFVQIYNDGFLPILGAKPSPAGKPARLTWPELWSGLGPQLESVLRTGEAIFAEDRLFQPERHGYREESYLTYSYSPLHDVGAVRGVLNTATETTERVRASRRLELIIELVSLKGGESCASRRTLRRCSRAPRSISLLQRSTCSTRPERAPRWRPRRGSLPDRQRRPTRFCSPIRRRCGRWRTSRAAGRRARSTTSRRGYPACTRGPGPSHPRRRPCCRCGAVSPDRSLESWCWARALACPSTPSIRTSCA